MASRLALGSLRSFLLQAMVESGKDVHQISNECLLPWEGAEYQYGTLVGQKLSEKFSCGVQNECSASDVVHQFRPRKDTSKYTDSRHDIVITDSKHWYHSIVEIKAYAWQFRTLHRGIQYDLEKIRDVMLGSGDSGVRMGFVLFLMWYSASFDQGVSTAEAEKKIASRFRTEFLDRSRRVVKSKKLDVNGMLLKPSADDRVSWLDEGKRRHGVWTSGVISVSRT